MASGLVGVQKMRYLLFVLCALAFLIGAAFLHAAKGAIHEIEAFVLFLISAVFLVGGSIVESIAITREKVTKLMQTTAMQDTQKRSPPLAPPSVDEQNASNSLDRRVAELTDEDQRSFDANEDAKRNAIEFLLSQGDTEQQAMEFLLQARQLIKLKETVKAVSTLKELIHRYPMSQAADKARHSLKKSGITD
jgi:hypothetical protein